MQKRKEKKLVMKEKRKHGKIYLGFLALLLFFMIVPAKAEAASYKLVNVSVGRNTREKVGSYYFWGKLKNGSYQIYASKSAKATKGTLLASVKLRDSTCSIVTNGAWVFYVTADSATKNTIYGVGINGKNRKKYATVTGNAVYLQKFYNNQLYYKRYTNSGPSLCSVSTKTKTTKTIVTNCDGGVFDIAGERYLYTIRNGNVGKTAVNIQIYDCQKLKVVKKSNLKKSSSAYLGAAARVTKKYFYVDICTPTSDFSSSSFKIYRCAKNGTGVFKVVATIKCADIGVVNDNYVYYYTSNENDEGEYVDTYYRYSITTKTSKKISQTTYNKMVDAVA